MAAAASRCRGARRHAPWTWPAGTRHDGRRCSAPAPSGSRPPGCCRSAAWTSTIYAREVPPHTTSDVAGALWSPVTLVDEGRPDAAFARQLAEAARLSHQRFEAMCGRQVRRPVGALLPDRRKRRTSGLVGMGRHARSCFARSRWGPASIPFPARSRTAIA